MPIYVKDSSTWEETDEIYVKHNGTWQRAKEIYIKEGGQWRTNLYESATQSITSIGSGTTTVPVGCFRASITLSGANGGAGGADGGLSGAYGGLGASITVVLNVQPFTTLSYNIGEAGGDGGTGGGPGGTPGGTGGSGYAAGGTGGSTGTAGWSGAGGGGGGASSLSYDGSVILVAGGGGGAGGRGNQVHMSRSQLTGKNSTTITNDPSRLGSFPGANGVQTSYADGAGSGAGGGGVTTNAAAGSCINHYDSDCYPGNGGDSYYNGEFFGFDYDSGLNSGSNGGDGTLVITWIRDK